jgi:hypothetical protein
LINTLNYLQPQKIKIIIVKYRNNIKTKHKIIKKMKTKKTADDKLNIIVSILLSIITIGTSSIFIIILNIQFYAQETDISEKTQLNIMAFLKGILLGYIIVLVWLKLFRDKKALISPLIFAFFSGVMLLIELSPIPFKILQFYTSTRYETSFLIASAILSIAVLRLLIETKKGAHHFRRDLKNEEE